MEIASGPALTLVVEKGPRRGEVVECQWGGCVRIGRFVKGNTFPIRDPSISQSHVSIQSDGAATGRRWTITDLGSSNGTFVNGVQIEPSVPAEIRGGDTIKIGERTTIRSEIADYRSPKRADAAGTSAAAPDKPEESGRGRTRSRRAAGGAASTPAAQSLDGVGEEPRRGGATASRRRRPPSKRADTASRVLYPVAEEPEGEEKLKDYTVTEGVKGTRKGSQRGRKAPTRSGSVGGQAKAEPEAAEETEEPNPSVDMEKMTVEEWFDRMEKHLPKVIHGVAEEAIAEIRAKAEMFKDYVEQCSMSHD